ncbi:MAG: HXXEE domain-containing protein [Anaerolineales bacterium]|nr:HXXEE domain-containing protein [Anaerolineales bacterium]
MRFPLDSLSFDQLLWLVPIFFMLHNMEEAPFMEAWTKRLPLKIHPQISTRQFVIAVTFLTLGGFLVTYMGVEYLQNLIGYLIVLGIQTIMFFNAFIPHIGSTIRFRMYSPGVVTATLITIPFSLYLFQRAIAEHIITWKQIWILLAIAPFAMIFFAFISLQIGKTLDGK